MFFLVVDLPFLIIFWNIFFMFSFFFFFSRKKSGKTKINSRTVHTSNNN